MPILAVNHHYFRQKKPGQGIYPISSSDLKKNIKKLSKLWRFGDETDIIKFCNGELAKDDFVCVITFDDGLKEQMDAVSLLNNMGVNVICYVPTITICQPVVLQVHKLHMIRTDLDDHTLSQKLGECFQFDNYSFDEALLKIQYRYDEPVSQKVKYFLNFVLDRAERNTWINRLFEDLYGAEKSVNERLYMDRDDLSFLAKKHQLGSHAHSHLPLAQLSSDECHREIDESIRILEQITNAKINGISYPYGGASAVSEIVYGASRMCGLKYGFTMKRGMNSGGSHNCFSLNRIDTNDIDQWVDWKYPIQI